ncbi:MAG: 1,4-dihydroxy-2-naphthoate octaprenyltransferase [Verrucomicrobiota bacterium]
MKAWLLAARPKTLPAAIVPVWVGCVLAVQETGEGKPGLALCTLLAALAIQIATNFFNDAIDSEKGADTAARLGPRRATASGLFSAAHMRKAALGMLGLAGLFAIPLCLSRGWPILWIGLPSLYFSYGYTGGPLPLAYRGLGEVFVILFFGLVAVAGTAFVQCGRWLEEGFFVGAQVGFYSAVLIAINNLRDVREDTASGKRTLAVRWGLPGARLEIFLLCLFPAVMEWCREERGPATYVLPLGLWIAFLVQRTPPSRDYNRFLALAAIQLLVFAILFSSS